jgi:hypothetical protein
MAEGIAEWYGVRCIFRFLENGGGRYEERITLWRAQSFDHAAELAGQEARRYAEESQEEFLEYSESYWIDRELFELDPEVFSSLRDSDLVPVEYINTFFSTGREHNRGEQPSTDGSGELQWYGVRCLFWWVDREDQPFEERITLWRATSPYRGVELAEQEAREYAQNIGSEYLDFSQVYGLGEGGNVRDGMVVFSLLRDSDLPPEDYIVAFFDTGRERMRPGGQY